MKANKQTERQHATNQLERGPYTDQQLNEFPALVYACMDPTHAPCDPPLLAIATQRRIYFCSVSGVNVETYTQNNFNRHYDGVVYDYHVQYLDNGKQLVKAHINSHD
jgi:hypothetical protein